MTLPEVCPLDESQTCKGRECHLFCLEWRTKDPTCLIGYSATSKVKSGKADRNRDTYAEDTFRKLGRQPLSKSKRKGVFEKGDWVPSRLTEIPPEIPVERKKESVVPSRDSQTITPSCPKPEISPAEGLRERYDRERYDKERYDKERYDDAEKVSIRTQSRLREVPVEQNPVIYGKTQSKVQEKPKAPEKVISSDKHTTIFAAFDADKKDNSFLAGREEKAKKSTENREKDKKLDKVMEIDLPDTYDEEFWS